MIKYRLKTPIIWGDSTIEELTIRRPTAGDFRGIKLEKNVEVSFDDMLTLASRVTATEEAKLSKMDIADTMEVYGIISNFINPSPKTGANASDSCAEAPSISPLTA